MKGEDMNDKDMIISVKVMKEGRTIFRMDQRIEDLERKFKESNCIHFEGGACCNVPGENFNHATEVSGRFCKTCDNKQISILCSGCSIYQEQLNIDYISSLIKFVEDLENKSPIGKRSMFIKKGDQ